MAKESDICQVLCVDLAKVDRLRGLLPEVKPLACVLKALGDETRLKVALALAQEEMCVCETAEFLGTTVQNASHHLRNLKNAGLATYRREGKLVYYRLVPEIAEFLSSILGWTKVRDEFGDTSAAG